MKKPTFKSGDNVRWDFETNGGLFQCICADTNTAVFAPVVQEGDCTSVIYENMFAVSNLPSMERVIRKSYKKVG